MVLLGLIWWFICVVVGMLAVRFVVWLVLVCLTLLVRCCLCMLFAALDALVMCLVGGWVLLFLVGHVWVL